MQQETSVMWQDKGTHHKAVAIQSLDWRLEYNAHGQGFDCPELLSLWSEHALEKLLEELILQHVPTWQNALRDAEPPDVQLKRHEPGYR